jgi:hypothetical protein
VEVQDAAGRWGVLPEGMEILPPGADGIQHWDIVVASWRPSHGASPPSMASKPCGCAWLRDLHVEDMGAFFAALEPPKPVAAGDRVSRAGHITPHFSWAELRCHDGTDVPDDLVPNAVRLCGLLLENIGILWVGRSWSFRLQDARLQRPHRRAKASRHVTAEAADIRPLAMDRLADLTGMVRANLGGRCSAPWAAGAPIRGGIHST